MTQQQKQSLNKKAVYHKKVEQKGFYLKRKNYNLENMQHMSKLTGILSMNKILLLIQHAIVVLHVEFTLHHLRMHSNSPIINQQNGWVNSTNIFLNNAYKKQQELIIHQLVPHNHQNNSNHRNKKTLINILRKP